MRLDLRDIIHVPDGKKTFRFQLDLSQQDFYGSKPIVHPVQVEGSVTNHAGALVLEGTARSVLELQCDRCGKAFSREKAVRTVISDKSRARGAQLPGRSIPRICCKYPLTERKS